MSNKARNIIDIILVAFVIWSIIFLTTQNSRKTTWNNTDEQLAVAVSAPPKGVPGPHNLSASQISWPGDHAEARSKGWPSSHPVVTSSGWREHGVDLSQGWPAGHLIENSDGWPFDHQGASSRRWNEDPNRVHTIAWSRSWPPEIHKVANSIIEFPQPSDHSLVISGSRPANHAYLFSRSWPPNHTSSSSMTWLDEPDHFYAYSQLWPANHMGTSSMTRFPTIHEQRESASWPANHNGTSSSDRRWRNHQFISSRFAIPNQPDPSRRSSASTQILLPTGQVRSTTGTWPSTHLYAASINAGGSSGGI